MRNKLSKSIYTNDVLQVAPILLGKVIVRRHIDGGVKRYVITEVEAYRGTEDLACHASKGRTVRTEVMFHEGGVVYVYLIYGMYWMLNIVTGREGDPSAVLIRGIQELGDNGRMISGPGRVGRELQLDKSFYEENLEASDRIWIEESTEKPEIISTPRVGIDYAGEPWVSKPWRFVISQ